MKHVMCVGGSWHGTTAQISRLSSAYCFPAFPDDPWDVGVYEPIAVVHYAPILERETYCLESYTRLRRLPNRDLLPSTELFYISTDTPEAHDPYVRNRPPQRATLDRLMHFFRETRCPHSLKRLRARLACDARNAYECDVAVAQLVKLGYVERDANWFRLTDVGRYDC